jgi:enoyl-CoA hydratase/carnithine racemase
LNRVVLALREDFQTRVAVIRGEGRAFCTGLDLQEFAADQVKMVYHHRWERALRVLESMEKIVIVGLHGFCLGGGLQLALACDIRVSTPDCQLGLPAVAESLIPGLAPWRLPKYIGWGRAQRLILSGENISGEEALRIGLVDHLVPAEDFRAHLERVARGYLESCSLGTRLSKRLMNQVRDLGYKGALREYFQLQERAQNSMDAEEAKKAYLAKRHPRWD